MKYLVVFALCAAVAVAKDSSDSEEISFEKSSTDCLRENNITKATLRDEEKAKNTCFYACLYKKLGMMNQDGSFNIEAMTEGPGPNSSKRQEEEAKLVDNVIKTCQTKVGTNTCKMAYCVQKTLE